MAKVSPNRNSFNAGVFSPLLEGRVDIDKYPASMRECLNFIAAPQGPAMRRSGSAFMCNAYDNDKYSTLVPFIFNEDQSVMVEFSDEKVRFLLENGLQAYDSDAITAVTILNPFTFTSADLDARGVTNGDQISFDGFPSSYGLNGTVFTVINKVGDQIQVDFNYPGVLGPISASASLVYAITSPYDDVAARGLRAVQSIDVLYLFCDTFRPRKLARVGNAYNWQFSILTFDTGPFMPVDKKNGVLQISGTGNPIPDMTSDTAPSGICTASSGSAYLAFDANTGGLGGTPTAWMPTTVQQGWIGYEFPAPIVVTGYVIYHGKLQDTVDYAAVDLAPGDFVFSGWDGANWIVLDEQYDYVLYESGRSVLFPINNTTAYKKYKLDISKVTRNGPLLPNISRLVFQTDNPTYTNIDITLSGDYSKLNGGAGFLPTDVGRYMRAKGGDSFWRVMEIVGYTDATHITARVKDEPFLNRNAIREWQIAYWSDTTGYPRCGAFFDDRLYLGGPSGFPDHLAGTRVGAYEDFTQRTPQNEVLDDSAISVRLNSRRLSRIMWLETDERGLLIGTGSAEWVLTSATADGTLTARSIKARSATARGSAFIEPVKIDRQVLFLQAARRTVREYTYVYQADGYQAPSLSLFASHMGTPRMAGLCYSAEPHSIVWFRRDDGSVIGLTYNREENVIGWHNHDFGGFVESVASAPSSVDKQDILWMVIKRTINGQDVRYIERLVRFWDFDSTIDTAHFVDCGLRYTGVPISTVYGLQHLEGEEVEGLADGVPFGPVTVTGGAIELHEEASNIVVGKAYESYGETSNFENGAADGTAQGKLKRANNCSVMLWASAYGEIGVYNEDRQEVDLQDVPYREAFDELTPVELKTETVGPFTMPQGYNKRGSLVFRQTKPLPFNVIALLPQMNTQDR